MSTVSSIVCITVNFDRKQHGVLSFTIVTHGNRKEAGWSSILMSLTHSFYLKKVISVTEIYCKNKHIFQHINSSHFKHQNKLEEVVVT